MWTDLIQLSGSFTQSVLHLNRSHANQPMGGVLATPLSKHDVQKGTISRIKALKSLRALRLIILHQKVLFLDLNYSEKIQKEFTG